MRNSRFFFTLDIRTIRPIIVFNMKAETNKGIFITFEGIDGSGKSTQMELAAEFLRSREFDVITTREPGGTKLAERIRNVLLDVSLGGCVTPMAELLLYLASRHQHSAEIIAPHLERDGVVLCDRFADSSTAYQGAGRGLGIELVESLNELVIPRWPDLTILIDIPEDKAFSRMGRRSPDRLEKEGINFLRVVRSAFLELSERHPERFAVVESRERLEETATHVRNILERFLAKKL